MLKARKTLETRLIVQQCAQQYILPSMFACRPKRETDTTVEFFDNEPRIPENVVGTKNTNNFKTRISSTLTEHDRGLSIQFVTKRRDPWPSENTETQKPSHTEGRKTIPMLTKCLDRADTLQKCGSFHIPRCAVTATGLKTLPPYVMRANSPERHVPSVRVSVPR